MADEAEHFHSCQSCGATIYPEHLEKKLAAEWEGKLLCHHCLAEKRTQAGGAEHADALKLVDEPGPAKRDHTIRSFGGGPGGMTDSLAGAILHKDLRRPLLRGSPNATRCRTFHGKLNDASLAYLNDQINTWADSDESIEIKFATCTIGVMEGKHADPHLIVTVFY